MQMSPLCCRARCLGSIGALAGPPAVGYLVLGNGWPALSALIILFSAAFWFIMAAAERAAKAAENVA